MKVNGKELRIDDFAGWAFIHALVEYEKRNPEDKEKLLAEYNSKGEAKIQFLVDGREFDFVYLMEEMDRQHEELLRRKAEELIRQKFDGLNDTIFKIQQDMETKVREKLGLEPRED